MYKALRIIIYICILIIFLSLSSWAGYYGLYVPVKTEIQSNNFSLCLEKAKRDYNSDWAKNCTILKKDNDCDLPTDTSYSLTSLYNQDKTNRAILFK